MRLSALTMKDLCKSVNIEQSWRRTSLQKWPCTALHRSREEFTMIQVKNFEKAWSVQGAMNFDCSVEQRLESIVESCLPLPDSPRVMDIGCGNGALIPHLQKAGLEDILAVDLSQTALDYLQKKFPSPGTLGNDKGVRCWHGDFIDVPTYMGPVDVIFFNSVFGNLYSQEDVLLKALSFLQPTGQIVVSHPLGKQWHEKLKSTVSVIIPHSLPSHQSWLQLISGLPFNLTRFTDDPDLYLTVLQIPDRYAFDGFPIFFKGEVIYGKGIGSKKLGVPTANLSPESYSCLLKQHPKGVYFGWCKVHDGVFPAALNLGHCPTLKDDEGISLEAHIFNEFKEDFYGEEMKVALVGFLRPEIKFPTITELLKQIEIDVGKAKNQLKAEENIRVKNSEFFS